MEKNIKTAGLILAISLLVMVAAKAVDKNKTVAGDSGITVDIPDKEFLPSPDEFVPVEKMPEMTHQEDPVYPEEAKEKKLEGEVWIKALVGKDGKVIKAIVDKPSESEHGFDEAALEAARKCEYKPAIQNGKPVAVWVSYKVDFTHGDKKAKTTIEKAPGPEKNMPDEQPAEMIYKAAPEYPEAIKKAGKAGVVWVKCLVNTDGMVKEAMAAKSSGIEELDKAALEMAKKCKFKPAMKDGKAVESWVNFPVEFKLEEKK